MEALNSYLPLIQVLASVVVLVVVPYMIQKVLDSCDTRYVKATECSLREANHTLLVQSSHVSLETLNVQLSKLEQDFENFRADTSDRLMRVETLLRNGVPREI